MGYKGTEGERPLTERISLYYFCEPCRQHSVVKMDVVWGTSNAEAHNLLAKWRKIPECQICHKPMKRSTVGE